jgi:myosin I
VYTSRSNCLSVSGIDDTADYAETLVITVAFALIANWVIVAFQKAMQIIGLTDEEQSQIFRMLAAILWLGNVQFDEKEDGNAQVCTILARLRFCD